MKSVIVFSVFSLLTFFTTISFAIERTSASSFDSKASESIILDFSSDYDLTRCQTTDATVRFSPDRLGFVRIQTGMDNKWPGVKFPHPEGKNRYWNLENYTHISFKLRNLDTKSVTVFFRVDNVLARTQWWLQPWIVKKVTVPAKQTAALSIALTRKVSKFSDLIGMDAFPQGLDPSGIDPSQISDLLVFVERPLKSRVIEIGSIKATGHYQTKPWEKMGADAFFPFVDEFGQFKHADWPGKIKNIQQLQQEKLKESEELITHLPPRDWNRYGGWKNGPRRKATGHFRVEKARGKWWFIDPEGYLFWSHGIDVVKYSGETVITEREKYFENLPPKSGKSEKLYTELGSNYVSRGFYRGMSGPTAFDFARSNLNKKYGLNWSEQIGDIVHKRLHSWGINTLGLWSDPTLNSMGRTPYVDWIFYWPPKIQGRSGHWKKMVDMWDSRFEQNLTAASRKLDKLKDDPWLIGVFVDNELAWQDSIAFFTEVLSAPKGQAAKNRLILFLRDKYKEIKNINAIWRTDYASWEVLRDSQQLPPADSIRTDADAFYTLSAEKYYKTVRTIIKRKAPGMLYLGSRLNGDFPIPAQAAAKYADVVSFNLYRDIVDDFEISGGIDKPVLIGEWHFGANDRGLFGSGLIGVNSQSDRADKYQRYAEGALRNPRIVGVHWFQYMDQSTTGRALDQENHQIGFVSIADTPYSETIAASRTIGDQMYEAKTSGASELSTKAGLKPTAPNHLNLQKK